MLSKNFRSGNRPGLRSSPKTRHHQATQRDLRRERLRQLGDPVYTGHNRESAPASPPRRRPAAGCCLGLTPERSAFHQVSSDPASSKMPPPPPLITSAGPRHPPPAHRKILIPAAFYNSSLRSRDHMQRWRWPGIQAGIVTLSWVNLWYVPGSRSRLF